MTVKQLLSVLIYFPIDGQDVEVRINGAQLADVRVTDYAGKLSVNLRTGVTARSYSRSSQQDTIAASNGKPRQVLRTIRDRAEIQRITQSSATRQGYQIRS